MRQRIRGRAALAVLGIVTTAIVLAASSTSTAARGPSATGQANGEQKPHPSEHIYGVVPASRSGHKPRRGDFANTAFATAENLSYHGGPVMHTNTVYAIYWVPPGYTVSPNYQSLIDRYFGDVAAASGASSNVYSSDTQFFDNVNGNILYSAATPDTFGGSVLDTNPLPPDGCVDLYTSACLSDAQLQAEIQRVAADNGWTQNSTTLFVLMTADDIGSCIDDGSSGVCSFEYYCAYHSNLGTGNDELLYANIPYADFLFGLFCDAGQQPNGDDADPSINLISHEQNEAITDPLANAWYDSSGAENGDKCAWDFGAPLGSTAFGQYNQLINGHPYMLQQEWSNASNGCVLTYQQAAGPPPTVTSTNPSSLGQGATSKNVTVNGGNFAAGASAAFSGTGITVNSTTFVDATHLTANITVASSAPAGARNVTVTNPAGGGSGSCSGCFTVTSVVGAPTIASFSPGKGRVGIGVTINGTNFVNVQAVFFSTTSAVFQTVSPTRITAIVPPGAATGKIKVVTLGGTATSANTFRVR